MTGKAIGAGLKNNLGKIATLSLSTEIFYSFIIIVCSLMIYFGTKELYELSSHKGIKYFRKAFLFFALAYFFRSFIKIILNYFNVQNILLLSQKTINPFISQITLFLFVYFSAMAIFYLTYSLLYKKYNEDKIWFFHIFAVIISLLSIISKNPLTYLGINVLLFLFILYTVYISNKNLTKNKNNLQIIYLLLSFFWIINILDILIPNFFFGFQLIIYILSSGIFLIMVYKVLKKVGSN